MFMFSDFMQIADYVVSFFLPSIIILKPWDILQRPISLQEDNDNVVLQLTNHDIGILMF